MSIPDILVERLNSNTVVAKIKFFLSAHITLLITLGPCLHGLLSLFSNALFPYSPSYFFFFFASFFLTS